jgi:hypothetical protein
MYIAVLHLLYIVDFMHCVFDLLKEVTLATWIRDLHWIVLHHGAATASGPCLLAKQASHKLAPRHGYCLTDICHYAFVYVTRLLAFIGVEYHASKAVTLSCVHH